MNQTAGVSNHCHRRSSIDVKDVGSVSSEMNWKGVGISLLVISFMLSLIVLSIFLLSKAEAQSSAGSCLTLDQLLSVELLDLHLDPQWVSDHRLVYRDRYGDVKMLNMESSQAEILVKNSTFTQFKASRFAVSPDLTHMLLAYDVRKVYRFSFLASYLIYNLQTREVHELNPPEVSNCLLQFASWGNHGQQLVFIFENNIYYRPDVKSSSLRLTSSGQDGLVYNGVPDWLYEEEVLRSAVAHWFSPSGSSLAFLSINDTLVPKMQLPRFTGTIYPGGKHYPYPKAGQNNPEVTLHVVIVNGTTHTTQLLHPDSLQRSALYISMVQWVTDECLAVRWLNRPQNCSILTHCCTHTGRCEVKHILTSDRWTERQNEKVVFSKDGAAFFITTPVRSGGGAFRHLSMMIEQPGGQEVNMQHLTSGSWEVTEILAYDEQQSIVYYLSNEAGFSQRHLYRVSTGDPFQRECVSCSIFRPHCSFYEASLSPDTHAVLLNCRGPGIPKTTVHLLRNISNQVTVDAHLEMQEFLRQTHTPIRQIRTLQLNNNQVVRLELSFPPQFEESKLYPLLLLLDSTPGGQQVTELFRLQWSDVLVSAEGVLVARVDARGSGLQGQELLQGVYRRVGLADAEDQLSALEYLVKLPYVDAARVGVFGEAYGGFLSSILLLSHTSVLRCGAALSPVFDWRIYASAFTERYFGFPVPKELKYTVSSLLLNNTRSDDTHFLILHGTADANVHFQHTAELAKLLSVINVNYRLQIFPDEGHDVSSRRYMLSSLISFYRECFNVHIPVTMETSDDD
ncbi:inactive dipeptidyl peptidase 10-like isoform X1 [Danio rerio]|uniref:Inactive dipeptidyl peptidase 10-like isoform X1 n=1 Tax=Danio rerio TaxID=7955 RepID=A0AC58GI59_DANRE